MKRTLGLFLGALLLLPSPIRLSAQESKTGQATQADQWIQRVVELTNQERAKAKLPPLKLQANLGKAAIWMAQDMAAHDYFDHADRQGRSIQPRLPDFGYTNYRLIGENIAAGQPNPEIVVAGWMKSPHHRENILNPDFREIGVGYAYNPKSRFRRYWVQDFGSRRDVYPLVINGEAAITRTPNVPLTI